MTSPLHRAAAAMADHGVAALLIGAGPDLRYLTGYLAPPLERLTLLIARADGRHRLILPTLERPRAALVEATRSEVELADWGETDDPYQLVAAGLEGIAPAEQLGLGDQLWAAFVLGIQQIRPQARWVRGSTVLRELRMRKSPTEVDGLRRAAQAIDRVHARVPEVLKAGRREDEAGRDIAALLLDEGHDQAEFVIVASGPNGASPHHDTADRVIADGDAVVVDIGGPVGGWFSDSTRNYVVGRPPAGYDAAFSALLEAQRAAIAAVQPGVTAASVDAAARIVLADAGLADAFIHRTGHGIGLEVHEEPYIVGGNDLLLEPGMTFSIEPGVYLPGRFGIRIEDIVAVTTDGVERLNTRDRAVVTV